MANLDQAIQTAISTIPECLAAGYVDVSSGMLLSVKTIDSHPREVLDLVAAATSDIFQGPNVSMIEQLFRKARGLPPDASAHYFQEIIVNSENLLHIFMRGKRYPDYIICFVCRKSANLGMALTKARMQLPMLEENV